MTRLISFHHSTVAFLLRFNETKDAVSVTLKLKLTELNCSNFIPLKVLLQEKMHQIEDLKSIKLRREKTVFCICENKEADQLRGYREADQRLCFRYTDSTIPLLSKSEISSF